MFQWNFIRKSFVVRKKWVCQLQNSWFLITCHPLYLKNNRCKLIRQHILLFNINSFPSDCTLLSVIDIIARYVDCILVLRLMRHIARVPFVSMYQISKMNQLLCKSFPRNCQQSLLIFPVIWSMGLLPDTQNCGSRMRRESRERFPHYHGLAIPTCITARAWRTCRDACPDR